jgi:predicted nuclease of predicted toxin-antitoxin system
VRLLFDQNLSYRLCAMLADIYPESEQVRRVALDGASDDAIWSYAARGGFAVVTLDADFSDIASLRGAPPKIIWLRCGNQPTAFVAHLLRSRAALIESFLNDSDTACIELYGA